MMFVTIIRLELSQTPVLTCHEGAKTQNTYYLVTLLLNKKIPDCCYI